MFKRRKTPSATRDASRESSPEVKQRSKSLEERPASAPSVPSYLFDQSANDDRLFFQQDSPKKELVYAVQNTPSARAALEAMTDAELRDFLSDKQPAFAYISEENTDKQPVKKVARVEDPQKDLASKADLQKLTDVVAMLADRIETMPSTRSSRASTRRSSGRSTVATTRATTRAHSPSARKLPAETERSLRQSLQHLHKLQTNDTKHTALQFNLEPSNIVTAETISLWQEAQSVALRCPDTGNSKINNMKDLRDRRQRPVVEGLPKLTEDNKLAFTAYMATLRSYMVMNLISKDLVIELTKMLSYPRLRDTLQQAQADMELQTELDLLKHLELHLFGGLSYTTTKERYAAANTDRRLRGVDLTAIYREIMSVQAPLLMSLHPSKPAGAKEQKIITKALAHELVVAALSPADKNYLSSIGVLDNATTASLVQAAARVTAFKAEVAREPTVVNQIGYEPATAASVPAAAAAPPAATEVGRLKEDLRNLEAKMDRLLKGRKPQRRHCRDCMEPCRHCFRHSTAASPLLFSDCKDAQCVKIREKRK